MVFACGGDDGLLKVLKLEKVLVSVKNIITSSTRHDF